MERIREARRSSAVTLNNGMSRRRPRSGGSRDSPDEDGGLEMAETTTTRLRDRVSKRDRDRDRERERLSRGKRRRDSMALHGGCDEGDDSSDDSLGEDEDEEEEDDMLMPSRSQNPSTSSVSQGTNHHHNHHLNHGSNNQNHNTHHQNQQKKSLPRLPARWRADEMIGVPVPRKARTACRKRTSNEWFESAQRQAASASPSRMSPASTSQQISPSGSNASIRKKIKPMSGPKQPRPPPPKVSNSKQSFFIQEEIEVAEVLFGLTRQFKKENQKLEQKESAESKSRASSPQQTIPQPSESNFNSSTLPIIAPKRKKPRNLKEDETPATVSSTSKADKSGLENKVRFESSSPKREKNPEPPAVKNGFQTQVPALPVKSGHEQELKVDLSAHEPKPSAGGDSGRFNRPETREESFFPQKEAPSASNSNNREEASKKTNLPSDGTREHNFSIDLMAPPPGKLSPEREGFFNSDADQKAQGPEVEMVSKASTEKKEDEKPTQLNLEHRKSEKTNLEECNSNKKLMGKERGLDLQLDLEKPRNEPLSSKSESQQPKVTKVENRQDKAVAPSTLPTPMAVGGWPGNLPPFGFMSQVPALPAGLVPVSGNPGSSTNLQPRSLIPSPIQRSKRCATHCYIAQLISYHQRVAKMNPFWAPGAAAAAATSPAIYGARPFNMGMVPPTEAALLGSQVPGNFTGRNLGPMPEVKGAPSNLAPKFPGTHPEEKATAANSLAAESAQRKQQVVLQQQPQSGPMGNMLPGPAFIFPLNQQQVAAAAAAVAAANRGGAMPPGASTSSSTTTANTGPTAAMNLSFAGMPPTEAQFLTILQNGAYPFPVPGHTGAPPSYRGGAPGQAMPFFNAPFYPHQMPHPSQLQAPPHQQQSHSAGPQQPPPVHTQQTGQKTGVSSSSSSSQKNQPSYIQEMNHLLGAHARQQDSNDKGPDGRSVAQDSKVPPSQKAIYGHNFSLPMHPQNFAFMSAAGSSGALSSGNASLSEKPVEHPQQPPPQARNQNARMDIASSQPFAMPPFGAFPGPGAAAVGLDFSSMVPNHHIFQNHPDGARHGYPHMGPAPGAAVASQHQKPHNPSDSKSASGDSTSRIVVAEEERKNLGAAMKFPSGETQHPLSFSKKDNEHPGPSISSSNTSDSSSRTLNLIPAYREGHGSGNRSGNATPALTTASAATVPPNMATPQQMLLQLQKQHQQQQQQVQHHVMQQQQQLSNSRPKSAAPSANQSAGYSERIPNMTSFPSTLMTFPQALMQGGSGNSPGQSPQWKPGSNARAATPAPPTVQAQSSAAQAATKNNSHHLHPQSRNMQQNLPFSTHQTQISFGSANSLKAATSGPNQPGAPTDISRSLAAAMAGASPSPSASKNSASGSPPSISVSKPGAPASTTLTAPQQQSAKNSPSSSSSKAPPPQGHQNAPSILGHPSIGAANNSSMKSHNQSQQQHHQHQLKQQQFGQPQMFFTHPYAPQGPNNPAAVAAAAAMANYHQKRQPDKTPQQQNPVAGSTVLRMPMPTQGLLHAARSAVAAQSADGGGHPRMPASFYVPVAPVSVSKPTSDQKPASGN